MRPHVVLHTAVSIDGRLDGFSPDIALFYDLAAVWHEDVTLVGADSLLAAAERDDAPADAEPAPGPESDDRDGRPVIAVVDSHGRFRHWDWLRAAPYWREAVALVSAATPRAYIDDVAERGAWVIEAGEAAVDLAAALDELAERFDAATVRVDSGGRLNGALLRAGLVDEVSLLVHPVLVGGESPSSLLRVEDLAAGAAGTPASLRSVERLGGDVVWLRYDLRRA